MKALRLFAEIEVARARAHGLGRDPGQQETGVAAVGRPDVGERLDAEEVGDVVPREAGVGNLRVGQVRQGGETGKKPGRAGASGVLELDRQSFVDEPPERLGDPDGPGILSAVDRLGHCGAETV